MPISGIGAAAVRGRASTWLPPYAGYWCTYGTNWIADKMRYQLTIDPAEQTALTERLTACPDSPTTVTLAR